MQGDMSSSNDQKRLIEEELIRGYSSAKQLHMLLTSDHDHDHENNNNNIYNLSDHNEYGSKADQSVNSLAMKISQSFTNSIRFILSDESTCTDECNMKGYNDDHQAQATFHDLIVSSPCFNFNHKFEDSTTMISTETNPKVHSKRRKTLVTLETTNPIPTEDGHAWRKYGQKKIQHFKYPKSYFRCTYKNDQGCEATKQVQRIAEKTPMYRTTYYGYHTCKDIHYFNPRNLDDDTISSILDGTNRTSTRNHCNILSFDVKKNNNKEKQVNPSHLSTMNMEDCHKNETPLLTTIINTQTQSSPLEAGLPSTVLTTYVPSSTIASPLLDHESEDSELFQLDDDIWDFLFK